LEKFDLKSVIQIRNQLDQMQSLTLRHYKDNPDLFNIIDHLCRISAMFADTKVQELKGRIETADPQGYIQSKLSVARRGLVNYEKFKELNQSSR
jgi:hypothetical protein